LAQQLRALKIPHAREIRLIDGRRWRWDFLINFTDAVEVQGDIWRKSGHTTGKGITRDCEKANAATEAGYRLLFFTPKMIQSGEAIAIIERLLK